MSVILAVLSWVSLSIGATMSAVAMPFMQKRWPVGACMTTQRGRRVEHPLSRLKIRGVSRVFPARPEPIVALEAEHVPGDISEHIEHEDDTDDVDRPGEPAA